MKTISTIFSIFMLLLLAQTTQAQTLPGTLTGLVYDNWVGVLWVPYFRGTYTNDAQGYNTQTVFESNSTGVWTNSSKTNYTNNTAGKPLTEISSYWQSAWILSNRTTNTYNAANKITNKLNESYNSGLWGNMSKIASTYNASGYLTQEVEQQWSTQWDNFQRTSYINNTAGFETQRMVEEVDFGSTAYTNKERVITTLNANNLPTLAVTALWSGSAWLDNSQEITTGYTAQNYPTTILTQFKNGTVWADSTRDNYTYTTNTFTVVHQGKGTGVWKNQYRIVLNFIPFTATEAAEFAENTVSVFPNPSTGVVNLGVTSDMENAFVTVQNANGQLVKMLPRSTVTNNTALDLSDLSNGLYFIQIASEKGRVIKKVVIAH